MNIVLDLDETLISASLTPPVKYDYKFTLNPSSEVYYLCKRPHLDLFLKFIFKKFKTVNIWTAATRVYALKVIEFIFTPTQLKRLGFIKTRDDLKIKKDGSYTKPLHTVFNKQGAIKDFNTLMIDDRRSVSSDNLGNTIIVPAFKASSPKAMQDRALAQLIIVLNGVLEHKEILNFHKHKEVIYLKDITS